MSIYSTDELLDQLAEFTDRIGDASPVRWSDNPQGGEAATRPLAVTIREVSGREALVISPATGVAPEPPFLDTLAEFVRAITDEVDAYGGDLPVYWCAADVRTLAYVAVEQESLSATTVVVYGA